MKIFSYYFFPSIILSQLCLQLLVEANQYDEHDSAKLIDFAIVGFPKCGTTFMRFGVFGDSNPQSFFGNDNSELKVDRIKVSEIVNLYRNHVGLSNKDGKPIRNGF